MSVTPKWLLPMLLLLALAGWSAGARAENSSAVCNGCHKLGNDSPVHAMMNSVHGAAKPGTPMSEQGCAQCHGDSKPHIQSPTQRKPDVSFGPHWSDSAQAQNQVCLSCHEKNAAKHWADSVHGQENLSCITCHTLHTTATKLTPAMQVETCTQCHKVQKTGMHHLGKDLEKGLACASCHNPHANPQPVVTMLANRSLGCRTCHDLKAMQADASVSAKAKTYHKAMASTDRTCIDCHRSVAHVAMNEIAEPVLTSKNQVTLFSPGQANFDWIRSDHPGAQPFLQGRNCTQCHMGEQVAMGKKLAPERAVSSVQARLDFAVVKGQLEVTVRWRGDAADGSVALMLDDGSDEQFRRAGCWAACHNDLPGQQRDRGQAITKYLGAALKQQRSVGRFAVYYDEATLEAMMAKGHYVELWRAQLEQGRLAATKSYEILAARNPDAKAVISARASYSNGQWTVVFSKPMPGSGKPIVRGKEYTFGIAIHGAGEEKSGHWVSLPMTFGINVDDVDFPVRVK